MGNSRKNLLLLRHADAAANGGLSDRCRPLNARGIDQSKLVAAALGLRPTLPQMTLCSDAKRTQQTLQLLSQELKAELPNLMLESLYLAEAGMILKRIHAVDEHIDDLLVIAHNPGLAVLASALTRSIADTAKDQVVSSFPTASLAVLQFDGFWATLSENDCQLTAFHIPGKT